MFQTLKTIKSKIKSKFRTRRIRPATPENAPATPENAPATPERIPASPEIIRSQSFSPRTKSNRSKAATKLQTTFRNKSAVSEDCALCLAKILYVKDQATLATCGHTFHRACINKLIENGNTICPLCRTAFTNDDIITPKEYKILVNQKLNQPHTLRKTLKNYDKAIKKCGVAYRAYIVANNKYLASKAEYTKALDEYSDIEKPPIWKRESRKRYNTNIKNQNQKRLELFRRIEIEENEKDKYFEQFKSKCKMAAPFTEQSRINFNPDNYHEFNEFIQSKYSRHYPDLFKMITTRSDGVPYKFIDS
jgi:hypothetical protein